MCHLIYDLFGGGISLGIELTEQCVCVAQMDGKLDRQQQHTAKTHKNKAHLSRAICFFFTTKMSIYRPYMQIGDYFLSLGECIVAVAATASFLFRYSCLDSFILFCILIRFYTVPLEQKTLNHEYQNMTQK